MAISQEQISKYQALHAGNIIKMIALPGGAANSTYANNIACVDHINSGFNGSYLNCSVKVIEGQMKSSAVSWTIDGINWDFEFVNKDWDD